MNCPVHLGRIELDQEEAAALRCGHVFCLSCITTWLDSKPQGGCPVCKKAAKRKDVLRLYGSSRSPSSSPTKNEGPGQLSAAKKRKGLRLRQNLEDLGSACTADDVDSVSADMVHFADAVAGTSMDVEAKCLAEEITSAAMRFQSLILPELRELESLRTQLEILKREKTEMSFTLQQKMQQIDVASRQNNTLKQNMANLQVSKNIAENNCSGLRQKLDVSEAKLVDAESAVRSKDEIIGAKEEQLVEYRRWLSQNKFKVETLKNQVKELENRLDDQLSRSQATMHQSREETQAVASSTKQSFLGEPEDSAEQDLEPPTKRRRMGNEDSFINVKLEKSCFMTKPKASFQFPKRGPEQQKASPTITGLNIINGQVKGAIAVGSRLRLGKKG